MKPRWSANTWVMVVLLLILVLTGIDVGRRMLLGDAEDAQARAKTTPKPLAFKVGDLAPDFTLPDRHGNKRRFAELVKKDTLLCFVCGCSRCRTTQSYLALLLKRMKQPPQVITVSTVPPEAEDAYVRDTGLKQLILYEGPPENRPVMDMYQGHPCPRVYRITADRRVAWIGPSPSQADNPNSYSEMLAGVLGFRLAGKPGDPSKPVAPPIVTEDAPPAPDSPEDRPVARSTPARAGAKSRPDLPPYAAPPPF